MSLSNNLLRIIVSLLAIPVIVAAAYLGQFYFFLFVLLITTAAFTEMHLMFGQKGINSNIGAGFLITILFPLNQYLFQMDMLPLLMAGVVILLVWELFRNNGSAINNTGATLLASIYAGIAASALIGIREHYFGSDYSNGGFVIIAMFVSIWVCDSAAYYFGSAFGKHRLYERVSPKKSWEGAIAGFLFSVIAMILIKVFWLNFLSYQTAAVIGLVSGTIGQIGDLVESLIKRDAGVKDSSGLVPGHGGVFDRFDSLFLSAPVIFVYLKYILK